MIRQATTGDIQAIRRCAQLAYARFVPLIGKAPAPMVADFAALIAAGEVFVAEDRQGGLDGFIVFRSQGGRMLLENVAVRPDRSGRGIGGSLIRHCEAAAWEAGCASVELYTNAKMTGNLTLYPQLGYVETGRRHEDGFDRVYFEKRLGAGDK